MDNSRRRFIKGIAAGSALCVIGITARQLGLDLHEDLSSSSHAGPCLREGLTLMTSGDGMKEALWEGETVFRVNREGAELLTLADGSRTLNEIIRISGNYEPEATADFFLNLARAGWLCDRLEVYKVAIQI